MAVAALVVAGGMLLAVGGHRGAGGTADDGASERTVDASPTLSTPYPPSGVVGDLVNQGWDVRPVQEGGVEQVATRLLGEYRDRGDCVLAEAGYLDLVGSVWGCVVYGGSWSEVCVVNGQADGAGCAVYVLHMDADDLRALVGDDAEGLGETRG